VLTGLGRAAMRCRAAIVVVTCVAPVAAFAGDFVIPGGAIDVTDVSRFAVGVVIPRDYVDVSGASRRPFDRSGRPDLCGMRVVARTRQAGGDAIEWNLLFSVVTDGGRRIGGVSAGSFTRASGTASAVPRRPITQLAFTIGVAGESTTARALGAPNPEHGIIAELPAPVVEQIWNVLDDGTPITVQLTDDAGAQETLRLSTLGTQGNRWYHGRKNSPAMLCLRALAPTAGPEGPLREIDHPL
jgi:hypothetical protein